MIEPSRNQRRRDLLKERGLDEAGAQSAAKGRMMLRAAVAAIGVAGLLIAAKAAAWFASGSVALLASLVDSVLDAVASILNFVAVRHSLEPPDEEHRYGHGKAEPLAGLAQAAVILISALFLLRESVLKLIEPEPLSKSAWGIGVILFAIAASSLLVLYQRHVVRHTGSTAISADSLHYSGDLYMNAGVLAALALSAYGGLTWADPVFGLVIAVFIGRQAWTIVGRSYDQLMDREFPEDERAAIEAILGRHPEVHGVFDLRTRRSGTSSFIQVNLELDPEMRLAAAHDVTDELEAEIAAAFPGAQIVIHLEPAGHNAPDMT